MIPTLLAAACTVTGVLAGICIGAALTLTATHRQVVQYAWNGDGGSYETTTRA
ncbi:hypothetical protein AB0451_03355 [Streptomyces sp. NPDC052000]|uniref:hypothetical protein n=1 Tax=Streptomyces sp. NPDC052000 TaxID=3155676 RepID=UPI00344CE3B8